MDNNDNPTRLGVVDKRYLFQTLLATTERLLYLNRFPVDQEDFGLSLHPPEVENAWRHLNTKRTAKTLAPASTQYFVCNGTEWELHVYSDDKPSVMSAAHYGVGRVFINGSNPLELDPRTNRFALSIDTWCKRQARLEDQMLRSAKVLKSIVLSCNTVGQYKRVSPDLLGALPQKYRDALQGYVKASPYPEMIVKPEEIDTMLSTLAFASLQPPHPSEIEYTNRPKWGQYTYVLEPFPRSKEYSSQSVRQLQL